LDNKTKLVIAIFLLSITYPLIVLALRLLDFLVVGLVIDFYFLLYVYVKSVVSVDVIKVEEKEKPNIESDLDDLTLYV